MTDMRRLGVLIIGAGDMGVRHARHWRRVGAEIRGVYDPDKLRTAHLALEVGADVVTDLDAFVQRADLEVVSVCTPTYLHASYTVQVLLAGLHVLCEKPAALTLEDAEWMRQAENSSGRKLRIGFMRRFDPACHQILTFGKALGLPMLAQATLAAGIRPKLLMHDAATNGGPIIDMCCHIFDQWVMLFGERPESVRAHGYTFSENKVELSSIQHKALDSAQFTLTYPSGGVGQVHVSWGLPAGIEVFERHTYMGPDGLITVDWPERVTLRNKSGTTRWHPPKADPWKTEIENFQRELTGRMRQPLATIEDGIVALQTSLAVLASVAENREVRPAEMEVRQRV